MVEKLSKYYYKTIHKKKIKISTNPAANPVGLKLSKYSCKTILTMKITVSAGNANL